jgi:membrane protein DedA with SNARE-associated domain
VQRRNRVGEFRSQRAASRDGRPPFWRRKPVLLLIPIALVLGAQAVATAFLPQLIRTSPLLLIILDSHSHDLLLASTRVDSVEFVIIGVTWRLTVHWLYYLLGRSYGPAALLLAKKRFRKHASVLDPAQRGLSRAANPAVFLLSDGFVCALAGSLGMSMPLFFTLHVPGTILHIVALLLLAHLGRGPVKNISAFIAADPAWLAVALVVAALASLLFPLALHRRQSSGLAAPAGGPDSPPDAKASDPPQR